MIFTRTKVKISIAFTLLAALTLSGCKTPPPPVNDDTVITSVVDGATLTHRHAVKAPTSFTPVNENYRALYSASVMTSPDYGGKVVRYLENGKPFLVLGEVENRWFAIADVDQQQLIGYVPLKAGVKSELYDATVRSDRPRPRKNSKKVCVDVGGKSKACRNNNTATWILE
ncbi:SH3 domain-containing protein [Erwinia persicina]|uniref:SH3 domain-containing protein n=1 Tax=Erwinia persicina TaxID=55211 RepID=UPI00078891D0|nr:SH3 domain-containing protein [Erwinia persicina]MBD8165956.1 SH3 domain-containing protein [Erwinia persicina]MCQ4104046.1 SH3 domain-containing protein [Erwinia persicina]UTX15037.1 SH3 domain-containing protein [Erwinia persicina]